MPAHDVLILGAGLAGQRAALAAADAGASVAIMSKVHPVRSHSVAAAGGINAAINPADDWRSHAYDTVKGSDFIGDQDAIEVMCARGARTRCCTSSTSASPSTATRPAQLDLRAFGGASMKRTAYVADITGQAILHVLYEQLMKYHERVDRYEEWFTTSLVQDDDGAIARLRRPRHPHRRAGGLHGQERDPRHRRRRPVLQAHHQRPDLHRRRHRAGLPDRRAADGHGDDPVPPDDAGRERLPDHRGRPRRGRPPAQQPRASASWRSTRPTRWSWPRATSSRAPSRPRSTRAAASAPAASASTSTSRSCPRSARSRRCARSSTSARTSPASTSRASRSSSARASTTSWAASRPTSTAPRRSRACTPRARSPASRSTAATASAPTRCWTR